MAEKSVRLIRYTTLFGLVLLAVLLICAANINYANVINQSFTGENISDLVEEQLDYTFKVSDKLFGNGEIKLSIGNNKVTGIAVGIGMTSKCNVDFLTKLDGTLGDSKRKIEVTISGEGDPQGVPIPGKIKFHGPLNGVYHGKKLFLVGTVHINGSLARYAGFNNTEELLIEIQEPIEKKAVAITF